MLMISFIRVPAVSAKCWKSGRGIFALSPRTVWLLVAWHTRPVPFQIK